MSNDMVNHPSHYVDSCSIECIDAMEISIGDEGMLNFCIGCAFKYIWRCKNKANFEEDLNKADWYISKAYAYLKLLTPLLREDLYDKYCNQAESLRRLERKFRKEVES